MKNFRQKRFSALASYSTPRPPGESLTPNTVKSRYGLVRGDVVFEQQIVPFERRGADSSRKEAKTQRKPRTELCDAWCGAPFSELPFPSQRHSQPSGMRSDRGIEVGDHSPFAVRQSLKFHVRDVVARGAVGFAVGG